MKTGSVGEDEEFLSSYNSVMLCIVPGAIKIIKNQMGEGQTLAFDGFFNLSTLETEPGVL